MGVCSHMFIHPVGITWQIVENLWESHMTRKNNSELIRAHLYVQNLIIDQPHFKDDPCLKFQVDFLNFNES